METMELPGIFVTIKPKEEALAIIDGFTHKYGDKHSFNARQDVAPRLIAMMQPKLLLSVLHRRCGAHKDA